MQGLGENTFSGMKRKIFAGKAVGVPCCGMNGSISIFAEKSR